MEKYFDINEAGYSVRCKLYGPEGRRYERAVLCGHGFSGHKDNRAAERFARYFLSKRKDAAVVTFDLPCHGADGRKKLRLEDCGAYMDLVVKQLRERFGAEDLCAYATSFSGYLVLKAISEQGSPFRKIALRNPAVNMRQALEGTIVSPEAMRQLQKGKSVLVGFDRKIKIDGEFLRELEQADITGRDFSDYAGKILILHGTKDEVIPFESVRAFAENNLLDFVPVENADHRFTDPTLMDNAIVRITRFFTE